MGEIRFRVVLFQFETLTGFDRFLFELSSYLNSRNHQVTLVTSNQLPLIGGRREEPEASLRFRLPGVTWVQLRFAGTFPTPSAFRVLKSILRMADVIYCKNEILDIIPVLAANSSCKPVVCGFHTALQYESSSTRSRIHNKVYGSLLYKFMLGRFAAFHCLNDEDASLLARGSAAWGRVFEIPLWVDTEKFRPATTAHEAFCILFVGRLDEQKGVRILTRAIEQLAKGQPRIFEKLHFTIVGSGPLESEVIATAQGHANVRYLGYVDDNKLAETYRKSSALALPSLWETFSYTTLEALSCGIPVIASDTRGPRQLIDHGRTGFLFAPGNIGELVAAIMSMYGIWSKPVRYEQMRTECRSSSLKKYSASTAKQKLEEMLILTSSRFGRLPH